MATGAAEGQHSNPQANAATGDARSAPTSASAVEVRSRIALSNVTQEHQKAFTNLSTSTPNGDLHRIGRSATMGSMTLARVAVAFALLIAVGPHQVSTCIGWTSSPTARMECCERSGECDGPSMASACCAAGERDDNPQVNAALLMTPPVASAIVVASVTPHVRPRQHQPFAVSAPHAFRNAILLI